MRDQAACVACSTMDTKANHELTFGADLYIVGWFGPRLFGSSVFLHPHAAGIRIGLGIAAASGQDFCLLFVLLQPHQASFFQFFERLPHRLRLSLLLHPIGQLFVQLIDLFLQPLCADVFLAVVPQFFQIFIPIFSLLGFVGLLDLLTRLW